MRYQISGKQIDIGEALQTHVKAEIGEIIEFFLLLAACLKISIEMSCIFSLP